MHFSNIILPLLATLSLANPSSHKQLQQCIQSKDTPNVVTTFHGSFYIIVSQYDTPVLVVDDPYGDGLPHDKTILGAPGAKGTTLRLIDGELYHGDRVADHPIPENRSLNPKILGFRDSSRFGRSRLVFRLEERDEGIFLVSNEPLFPDKPHEGGKLLISLLGEPENPVDFKIIPVYEDADL